MSTFNNLSLDKLGCLKDYTNDWDMDDLVEDYCSDLNKSNYAQEIYTDIERYRSLVEVIITYEKGEFLEKQMDEFNSYLELFIGKE